MSYVALYRKFRPKTFEEVKGQDNIIKTLKNQIKIGKPAHAYLFCGTRGTGKTSVAKIMARAVNCKNPIDSSPCNKCEVCRSILNESSLEIVEMDAASNNGIENIRKIRDDIQYMPNLVKYRVYIIDEVHMLSNQAFNALLKTLEEPPSYVIFILATTEAHKIPITILSRCQRYDFKRISVNTISENLKGLCSMENIMIEDKAVNYIARLADGAMRDALSLLDECLAFHIDSTISYEDVLQILGTTDNDDFEKLLKAILSEDILQVFTVIDYLVMSGREISQFINDFIWYLRNLLIIKMSGAASCIIDESDENIERSRRISENISKDALKRYIKKLSELYNRLRYSNQKRVLLELEVLRLINPDMEENKEAILERISKLEKNTISKVYKNNIIVEDDESDIIQEKEVALDKAKYEDLILLKKEWHNIIEGLESSTKALFKGTIVECFDSKTFSIVFYDNTKYSLALNKDKIDELNKFLELQYKKSFKFNILFKKANNKENIKYITKDEIQKKINMDVEIEDY